MINPLVLGTHGGLTRFSGKVTLVRGTRGAFYYPQAIVLYTKLPKKKIRSVSLRDHEASRNKMLIREDEELLLIINTFLKCNQ